MPTSDPFPHASIRCARHMDHAGTVFADSADLEGCPISQFEGAFGFVMRRPYMHSEISGLSEVCG